MDSNNLLPKRVIDYIHEMGVRALDHLAETFEPVEEGAAPDAVQTLIEHWKSMPVDDKEVFVDHVAAAVVEVVAASAALPLGLKVGKKAARSARKVIKKKVKKFKKKIARAKDKSKGKKKS
jgi:predicted metal-dependent TIM-barrel fold hydrolase